MTAIAIGAGAAVLGTGLNIYQGLHQQSQANAIQKNLKDPIYNIPSEFYQNREIARQMATLGLPQQQYNNAVNGINQNNASGLATLSRSANPGAGVTSLTRQSDNAMDKLTTEDANARQNNQRYFINENSQLGNQELAKQQSDVFDKYTRDFNQMQAYRGAGQQNLMGGAQDAVSLGMAGISYAGNNPNTGPVGTPYNGVGIAPSQQQLATTGSNFNAYLRGLPQSTQ